MTMSKIATKTVLTSETITSQSLAMALYGLKSYRFEVRGSKQMLSCLPRIVEKCAEQFDAQNVGSALYGLPGMRSDNADVLSLVRAISGQLARCREPLSAQEVGNALYGLQGMRSDDADVLSLVRAISGQVARCREPLSAQEVGTALYGLQGMYSTVDGQALRLHLLHRFIKLFDAVVAHDYSPEYLSCGQSVAVTLPFLRDHVTEGEVKQCERIITDIENKTRVSGSNEHGDPATSISFQSRCERRMHAATMKALRESNTRISHNEHLFGLFECDIAVRVPRALNACRVEEDRIRGVEGGERLLLNIEVDGVQHQREKKNRFCRLRDEYPQSRGVVIARIEVSVLNAINEEDLEKWIMDIAAKALLL